MEVRSAAENEKHETFIVCSNHIRLKHEKTFSRWESSVGLVTREKKLTFQFVVSETDYKIEFQNISDSKIFSKSQVVSISFKKLASYF